MNEKRLYDFDNVEDPVEREKLKKALDWLDRELARQMAEKTKLFLKDVDEPFLQATYFQTCFIVKRKERAYYIYKAELVTATPRQEEEIGCPLIFEARERINYFLELDENDEPVVKEIDLEKDDTPVFINLYGMG